MRFFKCKHPFSALAVEKEHTTEKEDEDFTRVDYHLFCQDCQEYLTLTHVKLTHGINEFLKQK